MTYERDRRYSCAAPYTIADTPGVLTVGADRGMTSCSPHGWSRVTHLH